MLTLSSVVFVFSLDAMSSLAFGFIFALFALACYLDHKKVNPKPSRVKRVY